MTVAVGNGVIAGPGNKASVQGVMASQEDRRGLQLIQNYKFETDLAGWSADPAYVRKTEAGFNGGDPFVEYNGVSGNFDNFTTSNDADSGMLVEPSTTYTSAVPERPTSPGTTRRCRSTPARTTELAMPSLAPPWAPCDSRRRQLKLVGHCSSRLALIRKGSGSDSKAWAVLAGCG